MADEATSKNVTVVFEGQQIDTREGDTVAAALLAAGITTFRSTPISSSPRSPYCMMGVCFECLLEIDGVPNVQACQVQVRDGMRINPQRGARRLV